MKSFIQEFGMQLLLLIQSFRLKNHLSSMVRGVGVGGWGGDGWKEKELTWESRQPPTTSFVFLQQSKNPDFNIC